MTFALRFHVPALVLASLVLASCGSDDPASSSPSTKPAAQVATATPEPPDDGADRAGELLDDWSATLLKTFLTAQKRGKAAQAGDAARYAKADAALRPLLRKVKKFAPQGRTVMSQFAKGPIRTAVVANGDAWQEWALSLDREGEVTLEQARKIADLAADAYAAHEDAYRAAGRTPPAAFQRRPDQQ